MTHAKSFSHLRVSLTDTREFVVGFSCTYSSVTSLLLWAIHSPIHYQTSFRRAAHTVAVRFPVPLPICYSVGFLLHFVISYHIYASRAFTLLPFNFPWVWLNVVLCVPLYATPWFPGGVSPTFPVGPSHVFPVRYSMHSLCESCNSCLVFSVLVSLYFPMNSLMFSRWVPAIFALPSLFVTLRVSYALNGISPCTLICKFSVYSTCFPSVFCSAFNFFLALPRTFWHRLPVRSFMVFQWVPCEGSLALLVSHAFNSL